MYCILKNNVVAVKVFMLVKLMKAAKTHQKIFFRKKRKLLLLTLIEVFTG
jgi:hypothetical protein